jgi:phosphate transport system substrate-binding protein
MSLRQVLLLLFLILFISCASVKDDDNIIRIAGSDTMLIMNSMLADEFMKLHPEVKVVIEGGGTAQGANAIAKNQAEICAASRKLMPNEIQLLAEKNRALGISVLIAKDALSIYLNTNNPIDDISMKELRDIFTCNINSWNEIDGDYAQIERILRTEDSGTFGYFKSLILENDNFCKENSYSFTTTNDVVDYVANDRYAIGYGGFAYHDSVKHSKINGILPNKENIRKDKYPIIRYLYLYTVNKPKGKVKDFLDFVMSEKGQKIISESGFVSIW